MKLIFPNKTELETDIIIKFLNEENIKYHTKLIKRGIVDIYDIQVDTSYEYYMFINKLVKEELEPYLIAMKSFCLPSYEPKEHINKEIPIRINGFPYTSELANKVISIPIYEEKQSNLLKLMKKWKWIK